MHSFSSIVHKKCNLSPKSNSSHHLHKIPRNKEMPVLLRKISGKGQAFLYDHIISKFTAVRSLPIFLSLPGAVLRQQAVDPSCRV